MKVALNLSISGHRSTWKALAWAVPALLVGLGALVLILASTVRAAREYRSVHYAVAKLEDQLTRVRGREAALKRALEQPQYRDLLHEVQFVNQLIDRKQLTFTGLAVRVAALLPDQVRLTGLELKPQKDGTYLVRMIASAQTEEAIDNFIGSLEDSPDFKDVTIANQGFEQDGSAPGPVNIACTARYAPQESGGQGE